MTTLLTRKRRQAFRKYKLKVKYIDIDYGSPYLIELYRNNKGALVDRDRLSYSQASNYYKELYNQDLSDVLTEEQYLTNY